LVRVSESAYEATLEKLPEEERSSYWKYGQNIRINNLGIVLRIIDDTYFDRDSNTEVDITWVEALWKRYGKTILNADLLEVIQESKR